MGVRPPKVGHQSGRSPDVHASREVSVLPLMPVFAIGGSRQSLIQQTSRHEDSSGHHNTMRVSVRLQARDCRDINWFWMSSAHRVPTAEEWRAANGAVKAFPQAPGFRF